MPPFIKNYFQNQSTNHRVDIKACFSFNPFQDGQFENCTHGLIALDIQNINLDQKPSNGFVFMGPMQCVFNVPQTKTEMVDP